jgi:hypothetical protein
MYAADIELANMSVAPQEQELKHRVIELAAGPAIVQLLHPASTPTIVYIGAYATAATAFATTLLALATFVMAWKTRSLAKSSEETANQAVRQSALTEEALTASVRPLIADVPQPTFSELLVSPGPDSNQTGAELGGTGHSSDETSVGVERVDVSRITWHVVDDDEAHLIVPIRNVGAGVARIVTAVVSVGIAQKPLVGQVAPRVLGREQIAQIRFKSDPDPSVEDLGYMLKARADLTVEVAYRDVTGDYETATLLHLKRPWIPGDGVTEPGYIVDSVEAAVERVLSSPASLYPLHVVAPRQSLKASDAWIGGTPEVQPPQTPPSSP